MATQTEGQRLILERVTSLEREMAQATMAKSTAERSVREADTIIRILSESLASLRKDLTTLGYVAPEEPA